jgi:hypothetical protein
MGKHRPVTPTLAARVNAGTAAVATSSASPAAEPTPLAPPPSAYPSPAVVSPAPVPAEPVPDPWNRLPAVPRTTAEVPPGRIVRRGRLAWSLGPRGRPFVGVYVTCRRCLVSHRFCWRWDWGLSPSVVSYQASRCFRRGHRYPWWVGLDPALEAENARVHQAAREAFLAWKSKTSERNHELPPVGSQAEAEAAP